MAFNISNSGSKKYEDIESLFRDLPGKKIQNLYSHQADILRNYEQNAIRQKDVALELPTGSGKTLVGMLIGEYRRLKYEERVLYLCPTKQLVNQVVQYAKEKYGIQAIGFSGPKSEYSFKDTSRFNDADTIAVTNYSSLFNVNPYFTPDVIILDDAHAAENYISSNWSLELFRERDEGIYNGIVEILNPYLSDTVKHRIKQDSPDPITERKFIEILPFEIFYKCKNTIIEYLNKVEKSHNQIYYRWHAIKDHLDSCNLYLSWDEILIRPIIPPSSTNKAFNEAKQRVYMSATLGKGGDLERISGVNNIYKVETPKGWDKSGLGRRFFIMPEHGFDSDDIKRITNELLNKTKKAVILVGSDKMANEWDSYIQESFPDKQIFDARSIEVSKDEFIQSENAVTLLSNRFDGIDFQDDEARLLILSNIRMHANLQERFIQSRTSASVIFNDRNKTRLIQAIGRCTRNSNDYAAVLILGNKGLSEWFSTKNKRKLLHPELQAEVEFGINQSRQTDVTNLIENYDHFLTQSDEWIGANKAIISSRDSFKQEQTKGETQLAESVSDEVKYQYSMWNEDYEKAYEYGIKVISKIEGGSELKGYRGFWFYLTAKAAWLQWKYSGYKLFETKAHEYITKTLNNTKSLTFIRFAHRDLFSDEEIKDFENELDINVENLDIYLDQFGINKFKKSASKIDKIRHDLESESVAEFEEAHKNIGFLIGFESYKSGENGAPDPYWKSGENMVFVFEDKTYENDNKCIPLKHVRQANSHETWVRKKENLPINSKVYTVVLTNANCVDDDAKMHCDNLYYWNLNDFRKYSSKIFQLIEEIKDKYPGYGDYTFREYLKEKLQQFKLTPLDVLNELKALKSLF